MWRTEREAAAGPRRGRCSVAGANDVGFGAEMIVQAEFHEVEVLTNADLLRDPRGPGLGWKIDE